LTLAKIEDLIGFGQDEVGQRLAQCLLIVEYVLG